MAGPRRKTATAHDQEQPIDKGRTYRKLRLQVAAQLMPNAYDLAPAYNSDAIESALQLAEQLIYENELWAVDAEVVEGLSVLK